MQNRNLKKVNDFFRNYVLTPQKTGYKPEDAATIFYVNLPGWMRRPYVYGRQSVSLNRLYKNNNEVIYGLDTGKIEIRIIISYDSNRRDFRFTLIINYNSIAGRYYLWLAGIIFNAGFKKTLKKLKNLL